MIPYSRPKRSDLYTLCWSKLRENHTLHSGTSLYSPYMAVPPPPSPGVCTWWTAVPSSREKKRFLLIIQTQTIKKLHPISDQKG